MGDVFEKWMISLWFHSLNRSNLIWGHNKKSIPVLPWLPFEHGPCKRSTQTNTGSPLQRWSQGKITAGGNHFLNQASGHSVTGVLQYSIHVPKKIPALEVFCWWGKKTHQRKVSSKILGFPDRNVNWLGLWTKNSSNLGLHHSSLTKSLLSWSHQGLRVSSPIFAVHHFRIRADGVGYLDIQVDSGLSWFSTLTKVCTGYPCKSWKAVWRPKQLYCCVDNYVDERMEINHMQCMSLPLQCHQRSSANSYLQCAY